MTQKRYATAAASRPSWMPIDVNRHSDNYVVHVDMPGIDPASIDTIVEKNLLQ